MSGWFSYISEIIWKIDSVGEKFLQIISKMAWVQGMFLELIWKIDSVGEMFLEMISKMA